MGLETIKRFRHRATGQRLFATMLALSFALGNSCVPVQAAAESTTGASASAPSNAAASSSSELSSSPAGESGRSSASSSSGPYASSLSESSAGSSGTAGESSAAASTSAGESSTSASAGSEAGNALQAQLTVDDVRIEGNRLVPTEDIMGVVKTRRGDKFDRDQVLEDLKAINGLGYFDDRSLQVLPEMSNGGVLLKIRVQENAPI
ncbi:MAG TPA: POTRA domain-containing protein, partial [Candidatus Obscuribacterales bacterium]